MRITQAALIVLTLFVLTMVTMAAEAQTGGSSTSSYDGGELFQLNCSNCHGIYGEGNGAVTPDLGVVLLDLRYLSARNEGRYPETFVRRIIDGREDRAAHGPAAMPVWGVEFSRQEGLGADAQARVAAKIDALTEFLAAIQISE